jgi:hypothetical protein
MRLAVLTSLALVGIAAGAAKAETVDKTLNGTALDLSLDCFEHATIDPLPGLQGEVLVEATAEYQDELDPLTFSNGPVVHIGRTGKCTPHVSKTTVDSPLGHLTVKTERYTLTLAIRVPPGMPIDIYNKGSGDYRIGLLGAPLKMDLLGSGDVEAADATDLDLRISGSSDVKLHKLNGPGRIEVQGSGDVDIDNGTMPKLTIAIRGSGDVRIAAGTIDNLDAGTTSSGDIKIKGAAKNLTLSTSGSGDIEIAKATGEVHRRQSGSGEIRIGD